MHDWRFIPVKGERHQWVCRCCGKVLRGGAAWDARCPKR